MKYRLSSYIDTLDGRLICTHCEAGEVLDILKRKTSISDIVDIKSNENIDKMVMAPYAITEDNTFVYRISVYLIPKWRRKKIENWDETVKRVAGHTMIMK